MKTLWIRFLRAVHVWTGRRLQRHAVRRQMREIERHIREEAARIRWN